MWNERRFPNSVENCQQLKSAIESCAQQNIFIFQSTGSPDLAGHHDETV